VQVYKIALLIEVSQDGQLMTAIFHVTVFVNEVIMRLKGNPKSKKELIE